MAHGRPGSLAHTSRMGRELNQVPGARSPLRLKCTCGGEVPLAGETVCSCGKLLSSLEQGVNVVSEPVAYWGEIPLDLMLRLLVLSEKSGWPHAMRALLDEPMHANIASPVRAAFQQVLPLPDGSRILDVGAGMGAISTQLARRHQVTALEGVSERARFIAIRKQQDRLTNLTVLNGDLNHLCLADGQFDAIVVNVVLEWAGLFDLTAPVEVVQTRFLSNLRHLLAKDGIIYIGIENRIGWDQLRGLKDHSGLPYTSLLPRRLARWVCSTSAAVFRSSANRGYRTYTYSYKGFRELFLRAGLRIRTMWIAPLGYNNPVHLVPLNRQAIRAYICHDWSRPPLTLRQVIGNRLKSLLGNVWFWRTFGSEYVFLLEAAPGA